MHKTAIVLLLVLASSGFAQKVGDRAFAEMLRHFDYDRNAPFDIKVIGLQKRDGAIIRDLTYASPKGGRVPAYVVEPAKGKGPFPIVLWGHWMMPGSPMKNRNQFLEEAILLARSGAVSLLIDTPQVRPGFVEDPDPLSGQGSYASEQQIVDLRRGLDLLTPRKDVDAKRIAFIGHSFDAHVGAMLAGIEKRIGTFVLMAGSYADEESVLTSRDPQIANDHQQYGDARVRQLLRDFAWDDPVYYVVRSNPAFVFLQFGNQDKELHGPLALHYYDLFDQPKRIGFYDAGHALNAQARKDRVLFLVDRLKLQPVDPAELSRIPQLQ